MKLAALSYRVFELIFMPIILIICFLLRYKTKKIDIGLGPLPLINNIYHKKALILKGYKAETFVNTVYHVTKEFDKLLISNSPFVTFLRRLLFIDFFFVLTRYRCLYIYFNGSIFMHSYYLWRMEPLFFKLAKIKTVVMPYGSDIQDFYNCPSLLFKHANSIDYPYTRYGQKRIAKQVSLWISNADVVISGCDWVYYMNFWHKLTLAHFSIDTEKWVPLRKSKSGKDVFRILHAPNHRNIKGTQFFVQAISELKNEGHNVELILLEGVPNHKVKEMMESVDLVADQLVVGWYAMFALEAMSLEKPVICNLNKELIELYSFAGLLEQDELPLINANWSNIKDIIRSCIVGEYDLLEIGRKGREFVIKHHSLSVIGEFFEDINNGIDLTKTK